MIKGGLSYSENKSWALFSKAPETFRARKAIFISAWVIENKEIYTPQNVLYEGNLYSYYEYVNKTVPQS